jgi:hypothetical protein
MRYGRVTSPSLGPERHPNFSGTDSNNSLADLTWTWTSRNKVKRMEKLPPKPNYNITKVTSQYSKVIVSVISHHKTFIITGHYIKLRYCGARHARCLHPGVSPSPRITPISCSRIFRKGSAALGPASREFFPGLSDEGRPRPSWWRLRRGHSVTMAT